MAKGVGMGAKHLWVYMVRMVLAMSMCSCVLAANLPPEGVTGLWMSYDDDSHEPSAHIRITWDAQAGFLGRIERVLDPKAKPNELCEACAGDRHLQPLQGLLIMQGGRVSNGEWLWRDGKILDPDSGDEYTYQLKLAQGGMHLILRGYWGPFWRTQTWTRLP